MRGLLSLSLAVVMTAGSAGVGGRLAAAPPPGPVAQSVPELVGMAPLVVVGKVAEIRSGRKAGSGEGKLQFNDVHVAVEKRLKGAPPAKLIVEHVATSGGAVTDAGPPYKVGERYVLFLQPGEESRYVVITQGRYQLANRSVRPIGPGAVAERVKGLDEAGFVSEIELLEKRRR